MSDVIRFVTKTERELREADGRRLDEAKREAETAKRRTEAIVGHLERALELAKQGRAVGCVIGIKFDDGHVFTQVPNYPTPLDGMVGVADRIKLLLHGLWDDLLNEDLPTDDDEEDCT